MKKFFGIFLLSALIMSGFTACKSKQKVAEISGAKIEAKDTSTKPAPAPVTAPASVTKVEPETTINEAFKMAEGETNATAFNNKYHVVVGSFSLIQNAKSLQRTLNNEGNTALVVVNEKTMYRVIIASYNEYFEARSKISQISNRFPDAWVLVQK